MAALIDTNVLVYRFDRRFPEKQQVANEVLRSGLIDNSVRIPHQALIEFMAVVTRVQLRSSAPKENADKGSILSADDARREVEELLSTFNILYPDAAMLRTALRGAAAYQLPWFDAHLWAYAEHYGLEELISEDFEHGRLYGSVRVRNPFVQ